MDNDKIEIIEDVKPIEKKEVEDNTSKKNIGKKNMLIVVLAAVAILLIFIITIIFVINSFNKPTSEEKEYKGSKVEETIENNYANHVFEDLNDFTFSFEDNSVLYKKGDEKYAFLTIIDALEYDLFSSDLNILVSRFANKDYVVSKAYLNYYEGTEVLNVEATKDNRLIGFAIIKSPVFNNRVFVIETYSKDNLIDSNIIDTMLHMISTSTKDDNTIEVEEASLEDAINIDLKYYVS